MKKFYVFLLVFLVGLVLHAQSPFVTTWEVDNSVGLDITIPTFYMYNYSYTVDFGDGTTQTNVTGDVSHTYGAPGVYTVSISGNFPAIHFFSLGQEAPMSEKIKTVEQWGNNQWLTMHGAFRDCKNLVLNATDVPDLSQVTNMDVMFAGAESMNQPINNWDVSNVTSMMSLFYEAVSFNQPLNNWDVSNVTNMGTLFYGATSFNQSLWDWDVSSVTDFHSLFSGASSFNQPLGGWDVSSAVNMSAMFFGASSFNFPLNNWDVSGVTNFELMFFNAYSFNQPLDNWDISSATSLGGMFYGAYLFNQPLNTWDVSGVESLGFMFGNSGFNQPLDNWDVSGVTDMVGMFSFALDFNQDLSDWNITTDDLTLMVSGTNMSIDNYEALLFSLATSSLSNGTLGATGLTYCNDMARNVLVDIFGWDIVGDSVAPECFNYEISGSVTFDLLGDGCDNQDPGANLVLIEATDNIDTWSTFAVDGSYTLDVPVNNVTLSVVNMSSEFTITPSSMPISFGSATSVTQDFCISGNQSIEDLAVTILPLNDARPGFVSRYKLVVSNLGTESMSNVLLTLNYNGGIQSFVSASSSLFVSVNTASVSLIVPNISPLGVFETQIIFANAQPPVLNGGDEILLTASIGNNSNNTNDVNPSDNLYTLTQEVVNSFDPNDKQVLQGDAISIEETDEYLDYIIRFQNSGTANATYVAIRDTLDTKLDWTTLQPISASHDYELKITNGNALEFVFNGINLPYESADEPGSHGYVAFRVKPKSNVVVGDVISGEAAIYFDYNLPIITNTVATTIMAPLATEEVVMLTETVKVYPNPASNTISVRTSEGVLVDSVSIYSVQGQLLGTYKAQSISVANLASGVYVLQIATNKGTVSQQLIKQ